MLRLETVLLATLVGLSACATPEHGDEARMERAISDVESEMRLHDSRCAQASSMPAVLDELGRHEHAMGTVMEGMNRAMNGAHGMSCAMGGGRHMTEVMADMELSMAAHASELRNAPDVASAHVECAEHRIEMMQLCVSMRQESEMMGCM